MTKVPFNIVSFGGGQNSTAMIIEMYNRKIRIDGVVFAETGNEMPETYEFLKEFKVWLDKKNIKFIEVKSKLGVLKDWYISKKLIPFRMFRHCTAKFKIIPINQYIKDTYGIKEPINMYMGIGSDEKHRAKNSNKGRKQFTYVYPLIEWDIDRVKCVEIIKNEGLSVPVKSGCYFCPFQSKKSWSKLLEEHPELYDESINFEKNCSKYPQYTLMGTQTLEDFKSNIKSQKPLFKEELGITKCGYCFA
jgi:3'-phosphoadenosine 5'-phosphosulfate sulfotransferase (PAPS reductase)/FAD synthetase